MPDLSKFKFLSMMVGLIFSLTLSIPANAVNPDEVLADPALEQRARDLSANLRCLVCQNQSIDDSDASLAKDLRVLVRQRLVSGDSDKQVVDYVVSRYGEFVLLRPRLSLQTVILWGLPAALILIGFFTLYSKSKQVATKNNGALSKSESDQLTKILSEGE